MAIYGLSQRTSATAAGAASWEIRSAATNAPIVFEMGLTQVTAVAGTYGIGRPAAIGITPTTPVNFLAESHQNAPTALTTACLAWGTGPTVPTQFARRFMCAATIGVGYLCTFPRGYQIPVSSSIVNWTIATAPVCDVYAVIEE